MKEDWKSLRLKADLKCGMRTSFRLTPNAQRKNKLVIRTKGRTYFRSVRGADGDAKLPPCTCLTTTRIADCHSEGVLGPRNLLFPLVFRKADPSLRSG